MTRADRWHLMIKICNCVVLSLWSAVLQQGHPQLASQTHRKASLDKRTSECLHWSRLHWAQLNVNLSLPQSSGTSKEHKVSLKWCLYVPAVTDDARATDELEVLFQIIRMYLKICLLHYLCLNKNEKAGCLPLSIQSAIHRWYGHVLKLGDGLRTGLLSCQFTNDPSQDLPTLRTCRNLVLILFFKRPTSFSPFISRTASQIHA